MSGLVEGLFKGVVLGPLLLIAVLVLWSRPLILVGAAGLVAVPLIWAVIATVLASRRLAAANIEHDASRRHELADAKARALLAPTQDTRSAPQRP